ncbi:MAG: glycine--tRNA ligase subunit beta, partial [Alphaproteobacteria bacterium]|nr:glycine--tRNA ligase subunit beta [Alphaproteobacteria bacterium]
LREEKKGPKVGAPDQAVQGFLRSAGLDSLDQCEQRDTPKGPVWFAVVEKKGGATADILPEIVDTAVRALPWAKSMRFAAQQFRWVRPLHRILAVFAGEPLKGGFDLGGAAVDYAATSTGHRFLSPDPFTVVNFSDYAQKLRDAHVILDPEERRQKIADDLRAAADREGLTVKDDPALLDEVTNLVEWPVALIGKIDDEFMEVPPEVLSTSMRAHQKYFSLQRPDGTLAPRFAVVANMAAQDGGERIRAGNERVLRARLADAKFFWDQDRATKLEDRLEALEKVIFHAKLGTVAERVERLASTADVLSQYIPGCDSNDARRAARLAKADLTTEMVGEFPELQGIMGRYYALHQGEEQAVADAIAQHYSPAGPNDTCPTAPVSVAVALAEKIDTLVGFWLIDEKPTGSKDPFALRRAALGVIRLVLESGVRLSLTHVAAECAGLYGEQGKVSVDIRDLPKITSDLLSFFADRLRVHLKDEGVSHDLIQALFALGDEDDLVRLVARVHALRAFLDSDDGANLLTAYRRAANILRAEEKKDGTEFKGEPDVALFALDEEKALADALKAASAASATAIRAEDFAAAMTALSGLRQPVDAFFDKVTVNADDPALRKNRLVLLARIRAVMGQLADFGQIEG